MVEASQSAGHIFEEIICKIRVYITIYLTFIVMIGCVTLALPCWLLLTSLCQPFSLDEVS